jgi:hypothetical protein
MLLQKRTLNELELAVRGLIDYQPWLSCAAPQRLHFRNSGRSPFMMDLHSTLKKRSEEEERIGFIGT